MATTVDEIEVLIKANAASFKAELAQVKKELQTLQSTSKTASNGVSTAMIAMGTVVGQVITKVMSKALSGLNSVLKESDQEYRNTAASLTKLATVMRQRGATQAQYEEIVKVTEAEERLGVVSASAQQNGLQELATYVGKAESLKKLTNVMNNLIVQQHGYNATADQALQTATMMGKVLQGQTGGMERIGYHLDEAEVKLFNYGTEEERVALLAEIVNDNLGDMNRELGRTNVGKQVQLANTWSQLKAQIGELSTAVKNLLVPAFSFIANAVGRAIGYVKAFFKLFGVDTGNAVGGAADSINNATDAVGGYGDAADSAQKKAKRALAAFDEMNVLSENDSSDDSSGGVDILGDLVPAVEAIDWGSLIPDIELPKWIKDLTKLFDGLNFTKITKAFKKFANDVDKFLSPVKKILSDVWNTYLKPFVTWAGNDLLPAFLNALGGAINLVGQVIGKLWDNFLKPFVDAFLVPIAKWTGGIIVSVLNWIGDALHLIASNETAVNIITSIVAAVGVLLGYNLVAGFLTGLINSLGILGNTIFSLPVALSSTTIGFNAFTNSGAAAATIVDLLKTKLIAFGAPVQSFINGMTGATQGSQLFVSSLGAGIIAAEAVVAAIAAVVLIVEQCKLATMEAELAEMEYKSTEEAMADTTNWHNEAIQRQIDLKNELEGITKTLADAQLSLLRAQEAVEDAQISAETVAKQYGMTIDEARRYVEGLDLASVNLTEKDKALAEAVYDLDSKEGSLKEAVDRVTESKNQQSAATEELSNQQWKEVMSQQKAEAEAMLAAGEYDKLTQKIIELTESNGEFTLENGEKCQINKENMQSMAEFIGDQLARIDDDNGKAWKSIWSAADYTVSNLNNKTAQQLSDGGRNAGENWATGVGQGARNKQSWLGSTISSIGNGILNTFKSIFQIHSPSKVMAGIGSYIVQGMSEGMESEEKGLLSTVKDISDSVTDNMSQIKSDIPNTLNGVNLGDLSTDIRLPEISRSVQNEISKDVEIKERPIMLSATLKIDGQDVPVSLEFAQHIAESINDLGMLRNTPVVKF